ncbi:SDR family oxidoreductase [Algoriphagus sp. AGSA1]|nr:SDR family oxidoreductase [Algoriphagus sp. AGSA1]
MLLALDFTKPEQGKSALNYAFDYFGRLDIAFNNSEYSLIGTIEESGPDDVRTLYETNVFGLLTVIKAALPLLRKQGYEHVLGTSSNL